MSKVLVGGKTGTAELTGTRPERLVVRVFAGPAGGKPQYVTVIEVDKSDAGRRSARHRSSSNIWEALYGLQGHDRRSSRNGVPPTALPKLDAAGARAGGQPTGAPIAARGKSVIDPAVADRARRRPRRPTNDRQALAARAAGRSAGLEAYAMTDWSEPARVDSRSSAAAGVAAPRARCDRESFLRRLDWVLVGAVARAVRARLRAGVGRDQAAAGVVLVVPEEGRSQRRHRRAARGGRGARSTTGRCGPIRRCCTWLRCSGCSRCSRRSVSGSTARTPGSASAAASRSSRRSSRRSRSSSGWRCCSRRNARACDEPTSTGRRALPGDLPRPARSLLILAQPDVGSIMVFGVHRFRRC